MAESNKVAVEELLRLAREDLSRNSLSSAEKYLEQLLLINNQYPDAYHLLGYVYAKKGKFKKALLSFERALSLDPFHTDSAVALSSLYNDLGKYKEGAEIFQSTKRRLERAQPGFDPRINLDLARKHFELGQTYMRYERFQEAHHEFAKAMNLEPDNLENSIYMARCLGKTGNKDGAIQILKKTLETHPKSTEARIQLGILYHSQHRLREAHREWQDALALDPENQSAQMYMSMFDYEPTVRSNA
ncbi:MAG: tetratricopeptide repeat protein [Deltaproteobacteria bacterium]|nr:tetratricopeptide repeat protein [Deltaproteobacteria bacterium]